MNSATPSVRTSSVDSSEPIAPRGLMQRLIFSRLGAFEKLTGVSVDYARWMANVSVRAFFKYAKLASIVQYRRVLPFDAFHVAHIVATRDEDCGTCVQIGVNLAKREGVPISVLRATLDRKPGDLPAKLADVYRFVESVVTLADDDVLRERVRSYYGDEGLIELGLAIAASRTFPVVKRTLGYAKSCSLVPITLEETTGRIIR